ncbi:hypothetical protein CF030_22345 [Klebsiella pneumoniae]|uniref:iron-containing alcohol dehydrogenase n=1 Tax=Klebsiella pneumoniae TaxID=573 RepID=UPI001C7E920D|nr:iron-containing alcohol dehydrogenase [Klebsiella pneumoniae]MBX4604969.1 hypothetical protein [Klebsiella pneumoniae]
MKPISFKTEIFFEDDAITDMASYTGERILVVTSGQGAEYAPAKRLLRAAENNGNKIRVFNGILPDPPLSVIADGVGIVKEFGPTVILALGGGSALDLVTASMTAGRTEPSGYL